MKLNENKTPIRVGNIYNENFGTGYSGNVWDVNGISPTLTTAQGGGRVPMILIKSNTKKGYEEAEPGDSINFSYPKSKTRRGRVGKRVAQTLTTSPPQQGVILVGSTQKNAFVGDGTISCTLTEAMGKGGGQIPMIGNMSEEKIEVRRYTPKECFRLMGFDDEDVDILSENGISNTQIYKMEGNSIVVNMLEHLFGQMFSVDNELML